MKIGLALSGGAAKGLAHIRVWERFLQCGIEVDAISGASAGALFGALIAYGYPPGEIRNIISSARFSRFLRTKYRNLNFALLNFKNVKPGLFRINNFYRFLQKEIFHGATFADLKIPFTCAYTDMQENRIGYFLEGDVAEAVTHSMTFPLIFRSMNNRFYDGGLKVNCPVDVLLDQMHVDKVVAVDLSFIPRSDLQFSRSLHRFLDRMLDVVWCETFLDDLKRATILIEPDLKDFTFFDFHRYEDARKAVDKELTDDLLARIKNLRTFNPETDL